MFICEWGHLSVVLILPLLFYQKSMICFVLKNLGLTRVGKWNNYFVDYFVLLYYSVTTCKLFRSFVCFGLTKMIVLFLFCYQFVRSEWLPNSSEQLRSSSSAIILLRFVILFLLKFFSLFFCFQFVFFLQQNHLTHGGLTFVSKNWHFCLRHFVKHTLSWNRRVYVCTYNSLYRIWCWSAALAKKRNVSPHATLNVIHDNFTGKENKLLP